VALNECAVVRDEEAELSREIKRSIKMITEFKSYQLKQNV
jgi:hypothetical protein